MKKYFILIAGCPATGKSYLIQKIKEVLPSMFMITPDEVKEMFADSIGFDSKADKTALEKRVWKFYYQVLQLYMEAGRKVILSEYPFSEKQKGKLAELSETYDYQVITIRLTADFEVLWERRHDRDLYSQGHLLHIMNHYHYGDRLADRSQADALLSKAEFRRIVEVRNYAGFQLGELYEFDVTDFSKVNYEPLLEALKNRIESDQ